MTTPASNPTRRAVSAAVDIRNLTVRAGQRILLQNTSARFEPGKITLVVGRSGVGKSTLLKVIAGLIDEREEGLLVQGGVVLLDELGQPVKGRRSIGVVFQDFALFDELTPLQNVRLARAHAQRVPRDESLEPHHLLDELGIPTRVPTASLSGGQRQRLAIARVLAYDPRIVLYDEPTSGLDRATAAEVARVIEATHANHPCTSIIVTHNYETLSRIADAIYLIDSDTCTLRLVPRSDWSRLDEMLEREASGSTDELIHVEPARCPWWLRRMARRCGTFLQDTSRVLEACLQTPWRLVPAWRSPQWGCRFLVHYLRAVASPSAWLYVAIAGAIIGFVSTYFTFRFLPSANYTKPLLIEDLLHSMGFALYRILVPILVTILIAARCGAAVASDVGGKRYGRQIDALRTLGAEPKRYLLTGILWAFLVGTPWLLAIGYASAAVTSLVVFTATHADRGPWFWQLYFHRELVVPGQWIYAGTYWLLAKTTVCAVGIAAIAYHCGARPKDSSRAVSQGVTATILWSTLFVLFAHFVFAFVEFG